MVFYHSNRGREYIYFVKIILTLIKICAKVHTMTDSSNQSNIIILRKAGLTESQAKGYLALIEYGALSPSELAEKTGESRTNGYAIADKLVDLKLATKHPASKNTYQPEPPTRLRQLLVSKQRELKATDSDLSGIVPSLLSAYRLTSNKPGILYLEGIDSLRQVYDDVIRTRQTLRIFPSSHDRDDQNVSDTIDRQIARQRREGIKTEVLLRPEILKNTKNDELFEARRSPLGELDAQIMIYGDNVAVTTFQKGVVTTIITSSEASATFQKIFSALWTIGQ